MNIQDRWGRQRGGRKARWDKLDRHPSALKSRLRSVNAAPFDGHFDADEAVAFADALAAASPGVRPPVSPAPPGGVRGSGDHVGAVEADADTDAAVTNASGSVVQTPSPKKKKQQQQQPQSSWTTPDGRAGTSFHGGDVGKSGRASSDAMTPTSPAATMTPSPSSACSCSSPAPQSSAPITPRGARHSAGRGQQHSAAVGGRGSSSSGNSRGRRSSLRSPATGSGSGPGLSRSTSGGYGSGSVSGGGGLGSFRGSPPPLHRRLSSPASAGAALDRRGKGQRVAGLRGLGGGVKQPSWDAGSGAAAGGLGGMDEEVERATPPPPPSLFDSVFKNKLPSLTPRKAPPVTPR